MTYDAPPDRLDSELVLAFFWKFSVFECALKREGFLRSGRGNVASADWDAFSASIEGRFPEVTCREFHDAVETLKRHQPRQQVVKDGSLAWREIRRAHNEPAEHFVLRLLRTARNNLFHGGKYPDGPVEEIEANTEVLRAGLEILTGCYQLHPGIAARINEAA